MSLLDFAIERFDLEGYVRDRGGDPVQSGEWQLNCPSCTKPKLIVNMKKRAWHCWVCQKFEPVMTPAGQRMRPVEGAGGLIDLIQLIERCTRKEAVDRVLAAALTTPQELAHLPSVELAAMYLETHRAARTIDPPPCSTPIDRPLPYLAERRITPADVAHFRLFWCWGGRYANRLVFPVFEDGRLVYFQARAMWAPVPGAKIDYVKALNPPRDAGVTSADVLMNLDSARRFQSVVVVEGPMDCVRAGADAVCTFGKQISGTQIAKLLYSGIRRLELMWDADAREEMLRAAPLLGTLFDLKLVFLPRGDPADHTREELWAFRSQAVPWQNHSMLYV